MNKKILKYALMASIFLVVAGLLAINVLNYKAAGQSIVTIGVSVWAFIFMPALMLFVARKGLNLIRRNEQPESSSDMKIIEIASSEPDSKIAASTWYFSKNTIKFSGEKKLITPADIAGFDKAFTEKRSHYFFDKKMNIMFDLDSQLVRAWNELVDSFNELYSKQMDLRTGVSHYGNNAKKKSGGAGYSISTEVLTLSERSPKSLVSNIKGLEIKAKSCSFYFFPTFFVVDFGKQIKVLSMSNLSARVKEVMMVGKAPKDSKVVGRTWKYVNVSGPNKGSRDKRHKDNYQLDQYVNVLLQLTTNEFDQSFEFQFSKFGCADSFVKSFQKLKDELI